MEEHRSILTRTVIDRGLQPEPVATAALVHLMERSTAAAGAVERFAGEILKDSNIGPLKWTGQSRSEDHSRPDLIGSDEIGGRVVLEAKFDAELTSAQLGKAYLAPLTDRRSAMLLFLVPADRLPAIWPRLLAGPGGVVPAPPPDLSHTDRSYLQHQLKNGQVLAATSWQHLLKRIDIAVRDTDEASVGDLQQLQDLVDWRVRSQWVPVMPGDLPARVGRQISGIRQAVIAAALSVGGRASPGWSDRAAGRYLTFDNGAVVWVGMWPGELGRYGVSPAWAAIEARGDFTPARLRELLAPLSAPGGPGVFHYKDGGAAIPLLVPPGEEVGAVTSSFAEQLLAVARCLGVSLPVTSPGPLPAEPAIITELAEEGPVDG